MKPTLKRGDLVTAPMPLYTRHLSKVRAGQLGVVRDFHAHPWLGVRGVFIAIVDFDGMRVEVNERALTRMKPGPSKYHPYEPA